MRPLRYSINVTLDGCCDHRAISPDEETHRHATNALDQADALPCPHRVVLAIARLRGSRVDVLGRLRRYALGLARRLQVTGDRLRAGQGFELHRRRALPALLLYVDRLSAAGLDGGGSKWDPSAAKSKNIRFELDDVPIRFVWLNTADIGEPFW